MRLVYVLPSNHVNSNNLQSQKSFHIWFFQECVTAIVVPETEILYQSLAKLQLNSCPCQMKIARVEQIGIQLSILPLWGSLWENHLGFNWVSYPCEGVCVHFESFVLLPQGSLREEYLMGSIWQSFLFIVVQKRF